MSRTTAVLQGFMAAYNRHDLPATMAFFERPFTGSDLVLDCDYAFLRPVMLESYDQVERWVRTRFAEGDRFDLVQSQANVEDPIVGGLGARRTSDVLGAIGAALFADPYLAKVVLDREHGQLIRHMWFPGSDACNGFSSGPLLRFPPGASLMRTRGVAQAFIDAYNDHNVARVLQLVTKRVAYRGCDWIHNRPIAITGKARLKSWLQALFGDGDRYDQTTLTASPGQPNAARIQGQRTNQSLRRQNRAPLTTSLNVALPGPRYDRIGTMSAGRCTAQPGRQE